MAESTLAAAPSTAEPELDALRQQALALALRRATGDGTHATAVPGLKLIRASAPAARLPVVYEPGLVLALQGAKQVQLGEEVLTYGPSHCLLVAMPLMPRSHVIQATPEQPYICLRFNCDTQALADLLLELDAGPPVTAVPAEPAAMGLNLAPVTAPLLDAALRLLQLLDTPQDLRMLAPLVQREIFYRVLTGPLGPRLRALAAGDSAAPRIARAVEQLTQRYDQPLRIDELAASAAMSPSTLHLRFKQLTTLSPLQFQKSLRLQHARRLMLAEGLDASTAAHRVGYESPSQFSREYRRLFGTPPRADISQLKAPAGAT
ncbi:MAG TPA: AraC family transcriptional regulator [Ideonella sp.]|uniref:AraC family transcriptional regulator n=1 Tax=Ideonella sp. TaxID=1929293 RepID=UPI002B7F3EDE|nr:AraC family transcriptional regulator [Ideonella sp.]HSI50135.1 AraC family transcriptional regulator [Ideonella sp.]